MTSETSATLRWGRSIWGSDFDHENPERYFEKLAVAGYDFVEIGCPESQAQATHWRRAAEGASLGVVVQTHAVGTTADQHASSLTDQLQRAAWMSPELVNSHTGRDFFPATENAFIFQSAEGAASELGLALVHETHRSRALFSAPSTTDLLSRLPSLRLCADFSHWCCVHESFLADQADRVSAALARADYLHLRIGHTQSPQITDLESPEWQEAIAVHMAWWRQKIESLPTGATLRVSPEFGPFPYRHRPCNPDELWALNESMRALFLRTFDLNPLPN
jgi:sugar phosphate isomerase/epimerase